jgi:hypothetical protein
MLAIGSTLLITLTLGIVGPSWAVDEVGRIREKCDEFFTSLAKHEYDLYVKGKEPQVERAHKDYSYLFKQKKVDLLRERGATSTDPAEVRAMNLLATALSHSAVRAHAAADIDQMYDFMMTASVDFDGESIGFGEVRRVIATENDRDRRRQIYIAFNTPLEPLNIFKTGVLTKMEERLGEWGFESYLQMVSEVRELELSVLEAQAMQFLESTEAIYVAELERLLKEHLDVDLRRARGYDIPYILRGSWLDGGLSGDRAEALVKGTFEAMNLKAKAAKLEMKPEKFCGESVLPRVFPLRIPEDIKMCYSSIGGTCDLAAHLYMRGKAEYIASIDQPKFFELGRLGSQGFYEAAGLLFQSLMSNKKWLVEGVGLEPGLAEEVARHRAFVSLFEGRRNCMSLLFQIGVYSGASDPTALYGELLKKHMKWDPILDKSRAALEMNDLDSACIVEGYFLAAQMRGALEEKYGEEWFKSSEAGGFLRGLWKPGQEVTPAGAANKLGYDGVDPSFLVADVTEAMKAD